MGGRHTDRSAWDPRIRPSHSRRPYSRALEFNYLWLSPSSNPREATLDLDACVDSDKSPDRAAAPPL